MAAGSGSTGLLVGLIFSILVSMGLLGVTYKTNQDMEAKERTIREMKDKLDKETDRVKQLAKEVREARLLVHDNKDLPVQKDHYETTILAEANKKLQEILSEEWIATEDWKNIQDPQIKQIWEGMTAFRGQSDKYKSLSELYPDVLNQLRAVIHIVPRLRYERIRAREEVDQIRDQMERLRADKQREIADLRQRLTQADDQALEIARRFDQEKTRLQNEKDQLQTEMARVNRDHSLQVARLESEKAQLEGKIRDLNKKQTRSFAEYSRPDGEVVYADAGLGYAWIDLGTNSGLQRNMKFQVYQYIKGGRQKVKGMIEVRRIEADMAQCAVLENETVIDPITGEQVVVPDPNDPVVKGDLIRHPIFDAEEQKVFVFLGKRLKNRYYNLAEVRRKISELGGRVDNEVSIETDFVVLLTEEGDDFQQQYDKATQFGVVFMRESEFLQYLGR